MRPWKGEKYILKRKMKKVKCIWNLKFDMGVGESHARENLSPILPRGGGGSTKRTGRTESEGGEKREETNQTRNSKLLFNFFFIDKLLSKLILALTCAQNP